MTEAGKNSRFKTNTGGRTKDFQTNPYTGHQNSQSQRQSQPKQNGYNISQAQIPIIQMTAQEALPLVSSIKQENDHLKLQKIRIQNEMSRLHDLSQNLLKQNLQLRKHYSSRTMDIKKLIGTITLNTTEDFSDIRHQTFLIRQNNFALVKNVEQTMRLLAELQKKNQEKKNQFDLVNKRSVENDQFIRELTVRNKQLFKKCEELKVDLERMKMTTDEQINQLLYQATQIRNINRNNLKTASNIQHQHNQQKPSYQENILTLVKNNKELVNEVKSLKEGLINAQRLLEIKKTNYNQILTEFNNLVIQYDRMKDIVVSNEQQIQKSKNQINLSKSNLSKMNDELYRFRSEKQKLQGQIRVKKQKIVKVNKSGHEVIEGQASKLYSSIKKIKSQINQQTIKVQEEIKLKINPQNQHIQQAIDNSKQEFTILTQQVQQLRLNISRMENPIKDIVRLQYQLKRGRNGQRY